MQASYRQFVAEHESIQAHADALLRTIDDDAIAAPDLGAQLYALAALVSEHIAIESAVIAALDQDSLGEPWKRTWVDGQATFTRLCADWNGFLGSWDVATIGADRAGFQSSASAMLSRLRDRLDAETQAFYTVALQAGTIALR